MPDDPLSNAIEVFSAPIEQLITALGQGIAQAQHAMDLNSIQTQEQLDTNPLLSPFRLQATWYQFPRVDLQLKLSLSVSQDQSPSTSSAASNPAATPNLALGTLQLTPPLRIVAQPVSASYQTHFNYDAQAASVITLSIVPVPNPATSDQITVPPSKQPAAVQTAALASPAKFVTTTDSQGQTVPAPSDSQGNALRFDVNFNAAARLWYVLQYAPSNSLAPSVVVAVDDATGIVRVISTP